MGLSDIYTTSDTALATFFLVSGLPLSLIDYSKPRYEFSFDSPKAQELADQYIAGLALTEPNSFNRVNKKLLRIIGKRCQWGDD